MSYDNYVQELVDKDLKGVITVEEKQVLISNSTNWRDILLQMKKRTEMQFTSSKARSFEIYSDYRSKNITHEDFLNKTSVELKWRVNAARFLQQVEKKLQEVKSADDT